MPASALPPPPPLDARAVAGVTTLSTFVVLDGVRATGVGAPGALLYAVTYEYVDDVTSDIVSAELGVGGDDGIGDIGDGVITGRGVGVVAAVVIVVAVVVVLVVVGAAIIATGVVISADVAAVV
jgi:hypothetical protein